MDEKTFIENFKSAIEIDDRELSSGDAFREFPEWSSLAFLSVLAMIDDEYDVVIEGKDFRELQTIHDVFEAVKQRKGNA